MSASPRSEVVAAIRSPLTAMKGVTVSDTLAVREKKHSDILQLPGAALVGADGVLLWVHRGRHTGDLGDGLVRAISKITGIVTS